LCGALGSPAEVASDPRAETMRFDELVPHWNGFFKQKVFFSYARCSHCGLLYAPNFFEDSSLGKLYAQMPPNMDVVPIEALRKTQRGYFDVLRRYSALKGGYIEVGPDIGLFTENCVRDGSFDHYWLFEPNRNVLPALEKLVAGQTFDVIDDMFGFSRVPDNRVDAAVMVHVLDHLLDPVATLKELRQKLTGKGTLLIVTHDESSLLRKVFGARWPAFCLQHPEIYNPKSMRSLLAAAGFDVLTIQKTVNYFPVHFLAKHLLWALGLKVKSFPSLGNFAVGLKLGNMITIAQPRG
jgi:hypothetical protein